MNRRMVAAIVGGLLGIWLVTREIDASDSYSLTVIVQHFKAAHYADVDVFQLQIPGGGLITVMGDRDDLEIVRKLRQMDGSKVTVTFEPQDPPKPRERLQR